MYVRSSLRDGEPGVGHLPAGEGPGVWSTSPSKVSRAGQENTVRFNQSSRPSGRFTMTEQIWDETWKTIYRSGWGFYLVITKHVHSDKKGPRSSSEVNPQVKTWVNRVCDQAHRGQCSYSTDPVETNGPRDSGRGTAGRTGHRVWVEAPGEASRDH